LSVSTDSVGEVSVIQSNNLQSNQTPLNIRLHMLCIRRILPVLFSYLLNNIILYTRHAFIILIVPTLTESVKWKLCLKITLNITES